MIVNHFQQFGLPVQYNVDKEVIRNLSNQLFRQTHPDGSHPDPQKFQSLQQAKKILLNDVKRANYLLEVNNFKEKQIFDKNILIKQMEIGEKRASYQGDLKSKFIQEVKCIKEEQLELFQEFFQMRDFQQCQKILGFVNFLEQQLNQDKEQQIMK
ncbi:Co-chaperone HscB [Spironucleus salmonicida]|uniref:Co-chaperone HscB n=1 Tax=Spironucleus salmonicida TaxID=348837 RepID=K7REJ8_9EUKA|nr:co-chaperone HscB [Spironucleus salmonicida]KAH0570719.1 Co-chaperone HscB [Spironucleus salmonicida]|eukprot:EST47517.1 Co-chaperone HscB [Spironucleus salmonicida]